MPRTLRTTWLALIAAACLLACERGEQGEETDRGGQAVERGTNHAQPLDGSAFGTPHALLIGIDDYESWPDLKYAERDALELQRILTSDYTFEPQNVELLLGEKATRAGIMNRIRGTLGKLTENDTLLIFFAGHGNLDQESEGKGYWIAANGAAPPPRGEPPDDTNWVAFSQLQSSLISTKYAARSVLLITDSCYGGGIQRGNQPSEGVTDGTYDVYFDKLRKLAPLKSRTVIASGGFETVPDVSEFARLFKEALVANRMPLVDAKYLFESQVFKTLTLVSSATPVMAALQVGPLWEGRFVFVRRDATPTDFSNALENAPVVKRFEAVPQRIVAGGHTTLHWQVENAKQVTITGLGVVPSSGSRELQPDGAARYELVAEGGKGGAVEASVEIQVEGKPRVVFFRPDRARVREGESVALRWETEGGSAVVLAGIGAVSSRGAEIVTPKRTTPYELQVLDKNQEAVTASATIEVWSAPEILRFMAQPNPANTGDKVEIFWSTRNASAVRLGDKAVEASGSITVPARAARLTLSAEGEEQSSVSESLEIVVREGAAIESFTASPPKIYAGGPVALRWSTTAATTVDLSGVGSVDAAGATVVTPASTTEYTLVATGPDGNPVRTATQVEVVPSLVGAWTNDNPSSAGPRTLSITASGGKTLSVLLGDGARPLTAVVHDAVASGAQIAQGDAKLSLAFDGKGLTLRGANAGGAVDERFHRTVMIKMLRPPMQIQNLKVE
jgi:hypothetical protein